MEFSFFGLLIKITRPDPTPAIITPPADPELEAYLALTNLYLKIQKRGWITLRDRLELEDLLASAYKVTEQTMREWWFSEFQKLNGWLEV